MLTAENITYRVGSKTLIDDASISFAPGKLHLMIGPNGAGKSTLIKLLAGSLRPQTGSVTYDDLDISRSKESDLAKHRAVLSQAVEIAFPLTVREVVMMGRYPHFGGRPGTTDERIADEMIELFDIGEFRERNYQTLSGGERQRVNFARVLGQIWLPDAASASCRYLFLDEPLTFLDIHHQIEFMNKIRDFTASSDVVTVGVVHDLNLAARFADHIVLLNQGRIMANGTATEVLTAERIREVFQVETKFVPVEKTGVHLVFD